MIVSRLKTGPNGRFFPMPRFERLYGITLSPTKAREIFLILIAAEAFLAFSYLGFIIVPPVSITTMHILVIAAALVLGVKASLAVALIFILSSVWQATISAVQYTDLIFSPFKSDEPLLSVLLNVSRLVFAAATAGLFSLYLKHPRANDWSGIILITVAATFLHTALVYSAIAWLFPLAGIRFEHIWSKLFTASNAVLYPVTILSVCSIHALFKTKAVRHFLERMNEAERAGDKRHHVLYRVIAGIASLFCVLVVLHLIDRLEILFGFISAGNEWLFKDLGKQIVFQAFCAFVSIFTILSVALSWVGEYFAVSALELQESKNEIERLRAREEMNRQLEDKNKLLLQQQTILEDTVAEARAANRAKSAFLNNISHDIRTPMNAILGFSSLALEHRTDAAAVENYLGKVKAAGDHLLSLLNDVLDMTRIESGEVNLSRSAFALPALLTDVENLVETQAETKRLTFIPEYSNCGIDIEGDRLKISQILLNLLSNAVKYTPARGTVTFTVSTHAAPSPRWVNVEFRVKDTGIGMAPDFLPRLYEPFVREETSAATNIGGTGLGMTITKQLVDLMNGTITVTSRVGIGTEFVVTLPLMQATAPESAAAPEKRTAAPTQLAGRHCLLAEDNTLNQEIAVAVLENLGITVDTADDGEEALRKARVAGPYDFVLMDIQMPKMDGLEAGRRIRALADAARNQVPIIALSADVFEERRREAATAGFNAYLGKPFTAEKLAAVLTEVLARGTDKT